MAQKLLEVVEVVEVEVEGVVAVGQKNDFFTFWKDLFLKDLLSMI